MSTHGRIIRRPATEPGSWFSTHDLMKRYGVSRQTIYEWRRRRVLPAARQLSPNRIGWPSDIILAWEAERPEAPLQSVSVELESA